MVDQELVGIFEIAELAKVGPSAVVNWRKRFADFPKPIAELKSGPVFQVNQVQAWLAKREGRDLINENLWYDKIAALRGDTQEMMAKVEEVVLRLTSEPTTLASPGVLLGRIQCGKTRVFLGIIARCFDRGFDVAVILTKGTRTLARQTLMRVKEDFRTFIAADEAQVYDIMSMPSLTPFELGQKLILVVKKEDDNLNKLLEAFETTYPSLRDKRVLLVDDEADLASVSFRKKDGVVCVGMISSQIDALRRLVPGTGFLQVTATPYSLYLQPEEDVAVNGDCLFTPRRPKFTVLLPSHDQYVGGDYYFEQSLDPDSPAYYFYREVPNEEREALKAEDRRRLKIEAILSQNRTEVLRDAILTFLVGGTIRRLQAKAKGEPIQKFSFLFHTEQARKSHAWQERVATAIRDALVAEARESTPWFSGSLQRAFEDLKRSVIKEGTPLPNFEEVRAEVVRALTGGYLMITKVNSDKDIEELLDENGQLKLRTPFNLFIGGQILDRGITISNLIAFYYGRNPKRFQQDTVLQHSRMYGARSMADLAVTRFYAPLNVYHVMRNIHELDGALRDAFESGANSKGVYFIRKDSTNRVVPCSPNKISFSNVFSIRPGRRMLPIGFQTVSKTEGSKALAKLDKMVEDRLGQNGQDPVLIRVEEAIQMLDLAYENLEFDEEAECDHKAHVAALEHLSRMATDPARKGHVWLLAARDRKVRRYREEGRFSNAPDTKQQADLARGKADTIPVLALFRQDGMVDHGWRGLPFWWPVIVTPRAAVTSIFASETPGNPN